MLTEYYLIIVLLQSSQRDQCKLPDKHVKSSRSRSRSNKDALLKFQGQGKSIKIVSCWNILGKIILDEYSSECQSYY